MKLLKLEIRNIASIEEAVIDFSSPAFASESIFLIHGETGSGKSSILDAICLALYKKTPRLEAASGNDYIDEAFTKRGEGEVTFRTSDVEQYIRRGTRPGEDCFSSLTFIANDGLTYTACLRFNIKSTGNIGETVWTLLKPDGTVLRGKGQGNLKEEISDKVVSPVINRLVGLTYKQFCRTTMLAQGEFTKLLKAPEAERCQILEKITDTGRYKLIGEALNDRLIKARSARKELEAKLLEVPSAEPGQEDALLSEKNACQTAVLQHAILSRTYQCQMDWLEHADSLKEALEKARLDYAEASAAVHSPEHRQAMQNVADWRASEKERQAVLTLQRIDSQRTQAVEEWGRMNESLSHLTAALAWQQTALAGAEQEATSRKQGLALLEQRKNDTQSAVAAYDLSALSASRNIHTARIADARVLLAAIEDHAAKRLRSEDQQLRITALAEKEQAAEKAFLTASTTFENASKNLRDTMSVYDATAARVGHANAIIAELHDGDTCPVCHSVYHRALDTEDILQPLQKACRDASEAEEDARRKYESAEKALRDARSEASIARTQLTAVVAPALRAAAEALSAACHKLRLDPQSASLASDASELIAASEQHIKALDEDISKATSLQATFSEAVRLYNSALKADAAADRQLLSMRDEYRSAQTDLQAIASVTDDGLALRVRALPPAEDKQLRAHASSLRLAYNTWHTRALANRSDKQAALKALAESALPETRIRELCTTFTSQSIEALAAAFKAAEDRLTAAQTAFATRQAEQEAHTLAGRPWFGLSLPELRLLKQQNDAAITEATLRIGAIAQALLAIAQHSARAAELRAEIDQLEQRIDLLNAVCRDFGSDRFSRAVQGLLLGELLDHANEYLCHFTTRYTLSCQPDSTAILVCDTYCGGIARPVDMLSGGESFMISLSLALGLVGMGSASFRVDTLFIDEGFGTLDANSLETVISTLEKLRQLSGRQVGIISHVDELRKRIALRIAVRRKPGASAISEVILSSGPSGALESPRIS